MKRFIKTLAILVVTSITFSTATNAQEEKTGPSFSVGSDIYSNYVWRGSRLGGPAFQPTVKFTAGGFTAGVWGSFDSQGYAEVDPYVSYSFPFGLSLGVTDYYYPGAGSFFNDSTNAFELNVGFTKGGFSLSGNYILNEAPLAGSVGDDKYFQVGYAFSKFNVFIGAGDGWHTSDGDFAVCNIGLGTTKEIKLSETFSVPVTGQVILNPEKEQLFLVVGFSL
jgi:uncharacterized protein (TIGR02001 family)